VTLKLSTDEFEIFSLVKGALGTPKGLQRQVRIFLEKLMSFFYQRYGSFVLEERRGIDIGIQVRTR
jgi:hypothetical protein